MDTWTAARRVEGTTGSLPDMAHEPAVDLGYSQCHFDYLSAGLQNVHVRRAPQGNSGRSRRQSCASGSLLPAGRRHDPLWGDRLYNRYWKACGTTHIRHDSDQDGATYRGWQGIHGCELGMRWRLAMESIDLQSMSLDELWALHETICS